MLTVTINILQQLTNTTRHTHTNQPIPTNRRHNRTTSHILIMNQSQLSTIHNITINIRQHTIQVRTRRTRQRRLRSLTNVILIKPSHTKQINLPILRRQRMLTRHQVRHRLLRRHPMTTRNITRRRIMMINRHNQITLRHTILKKSRRRLQRHRNRTLTRLIINHRHRTRPLLITLTLPSINSTRHLSTHISRQRITNHQRYRLLSRPYIMTSTHRTISLHTHQTMNHLRRRTHHLITIIKTLNKLIRTTNASRIIHRDKPSHHRHRNYNRPSHISVRSIPPTKNNKIQPIHKRPRTINLTRKYIIP